MNEDYYGYSGEKWQALVVGLIVLTIMLLMASFIFQAGRWYEQTLYHSSNIESPIGGEN